MLAEKMNDDVVKSAVQARTGFGASEFHHRHIGPNADEVRAMIATLGKKTLDEVMNDVVPTSVRRAKPLTLSRFPAALSEYEALERLKGVAAKNKVARSFIGMGYYDCITPPVIQRNILENPGWYTQYTPYQAEIAQGRLEALLNYQTMVMDLTGMQIANASLLDEGTAAAEAMGRAPFTSTSCPIPFIRRPLLL
jgi:glycine dehydrogenase